MPFVTWLHRRIRWIIIGLCATGYVTSSMFTLISTNGTISAYRETGHGSASSGLIDALKWNKIGIGAELINFVITGLTFGKWIPSIVFIPCLFVYRGATVSWLFLSLIFGYYRTIPAIRSDALLIIIFSVFSLFFGFSGASAFFADDFHIGTNNRRHPPRPVRLPFNWRESTLLRPTPALNFNEPEIEPDPQLVKPPNPSIVSIESGDVLVITKCQQPPKKDGGDDSPASSLNTKFSVDISTTEPEPLPSPVSSIGSTPKEQICCDLPPIVEINVPTLSNNL